MSVVNNYVKGTFNLGTDISVTIIDNDTNLPIDLAGRLTEYDMNEIVGKVKSEPIDTLYTQTRETRGGWSGNLKIDRATGAIDRLTYANSQLYYNKQGQKYYTMYATVQNSEDGSIDTFTFVYCTIHASQSGTYRKDQKVEITLEIDAQDRQVA